MTTQIERHDPYAPLRYRDYRLLLIGRFITSFSGEMFSFAIGWELWLRTKSELALGLVGLTQVMPIILLSLFAGHAADQYNRKRIVLLVVPRIVGPNHPAPTILMPLETCRAFVANDRDRYLIGCLMLIEAVAA